MLSSWALCRGEGLRAISAPPVAAGPMALATPYPTLDMRLATESSTVEQKFKEYTLFQALSFDSAHCRKWPSVWRENFRSAITRKPVLYLWKPAFFQLVSKVLCIEILLRAYSTFLLKEERI